MKKSQKIIISGVIGNVLENYDYVLYANFAIIISKLFFPSSNLYNSLLLTFGVFAAGFLMRPLGAIFFGYIGDKYGRRTSFSYSIILMSIPTSIIGLLPSYHDIGILAPIILIIIRLLQGLSIGGETSGFMTYIMESMPEFKKKTLLGSIALSSTALGLFFGFLASFICNLYFVNDYSWRIPFLISFPVGLVGLYIRSRLDETREFTDLRAKNLLSESPIKELFLNHTRKFFLICGLFISISVPFYIFFGFLITFLVKYSHYSELQVSTIYLCCSLLFVIFPLISGLLSDKFGVYKILIYSITTFFIFVFPIFILILSSNFILTLIGCILFIFLISLYQGSIPSIIIKIFPTKIRSTGTAISFNLVSVIFGGFTPLLLTWLIKSTESNFIIPTYLTISSIITIITLYKCRKHNIL